MIRLLMMRTVITIIAILLGSPVWSQIDNTMITIHERPTISNIDYTCNTGTVSVIISANDTVGATYAVTEVLPTTVSIPPSNNTGIFDLTGTTAAGFSITNQYSCMLDTMVIFNCNDPLPITFVSIDAQLYNKDKAKIIWRVIEDPSVLSYELLESEDGINFSLLHTTAARYHTGEGIYEEIDYRLIQGNNYYKIKVLHDDNTITYSPVRKVYYQENGSSDLLLFPNPTDGIVNISLFAAAEDELEVLVYDNLSRIVIPSANYKIQKGNNTVQLDISRLSAATYIFKYNLPHNKMTGSIKIVKKE